jgi:hypothetical protein
MIHAAEHMLVAKGEETTYEIQTYPENASYDVRITYKEKQDGTDAPSTSTTFTVKDGVIKADTGTAAGFYTISIYDQEDDDSTSEVVEGKFLDSITVEVKNAVSA